MSERVIMVKMREGDKGRKGQAEGGGGNKCMRAETNAVMPPMQHMLSNRHTLHIHSPGWLHCHATLCTCMCTSAFKKTHIILLPPLPLLTALPPAPNQCTQIYASHAAHAEQQAYTPHVHTLSCLAAKGTVTQENVHACACVLLLSTMKGTSSPF